MWLLFAGIWRMSSVRGLLLGCSELSPVQPLQALSSSCLGLEKGPCWCQLLVSLSLPLTPLPSVILLLLSLSLHLSLSISFSLYACASKVPQLSFLKCHLLYIFRVDYTPPPGNCTSLSPALVFQAGFSSHLQFVSLVVGFGFVV